MLYVINIRVNWNCSDVE